MISPDNQPAPPSRLKARVTNVVGILLALSLLAAAIFVHPAASAALSAPGQASSPGPENEEVEAEEDECEEEEEEEECEEGEDEEFGTEGALLLPPECLLHTAEAEVTASIAHDTVHLTIHYTSTTPTNISVDYWLKGGKGSLKLKETTRHFARQGVFRDDEHLSDRAMSKVRAARAFVVHLDIPAAPASCARYSTQRLTAKRVDGDRTTWSRPG